MPGGLVFNGFMGIIGRSTRADRPNRRCRWALVELLKKQWWVLIRAWALNRDNTVHVVGHFLCELATQDNGQYRSKQAFT